MSILRADVIAPVVDNGRIGVGIQYGSEALPDSRLVFANIRPERMGHPHLAPTDQQANQVMELLVGDALDVQEHLRRLRTISGRAWR